MAGQTLAEVEQVRDDEDREHRRFVPIKQATAILRREGKTPFAGLNGIVIASSLVTAVSSSSVGLFVLPVRVLPDV